MIQRQKHIGLNKLRLDRRRTHSEDRLLGKHRRAFRHRPDITGETERAQKIEKILTKGAFGAQIRNVFLVKMQLLNIAHHLFQPRRNGKSAAVGHAAEKDVKIADTVLQPSLEIAVAHGQFVKVKQHGVIDILFHTKASSLLSFAAFCQRFITVICSASIKSRASSCSLGSNEAVHAASTMISASGAAALAITALLSTHI